MGRRSDHSREELTELVLAAARDIVREDGVDALSSRRIAARIGYSAGTLYNLFDDIDALTVALNGRTLDALYDFLVATPLPEDPEAGLLTLAKGYIAYTRTNAPLWTLLFRYSLPGNAQMPDWYHAKIARLLGLMDACLTPFFGPGEDAARRHTTRVLWASLHGMCSLESQNKMIPGETIEAMVTSLVENYLRGLRTERTDIVT